MARKKDVRRRKTRTREHFIADIAVNHVERHVLFAGCTLERIVHDYGLDAIVFTYNRSGEVESGVIYLQVKASERLRRVQDGKAVSIRISRSDLLNWIAQPMPVMLILYDVALDRAYWLYVQQHFERLRGFNVFGAGYTVTVEIPAAHVLNRDAITKLADYLDTVRKGIGGRVHHG